MFIRRLTPSDAPAYRSLMLDAYARHPDAFTATVAERASLPLSFWQARIRTDPHANDLVLGAFHESQLVGVVGLSFETRPKTRHKCTLFGMYVVPQFRHGGIGQQLVMALLDAAKARDGIKLVQLTVTDTNTAAQKLYEHCGFVVFGVEPFAIAEGDTYHAKVHMWCNLGLLNDAITP
jgi:ribosomal protein S18 acetylase RimI-like enzyme